MLSALASIFIAMGETFMKTSENVAKIIEKWYRELKFPEKYDGEFYDALSTIYVDENAKAADYDLKEENGKKNLLYHLYFCEALNEEYIKKGIPYDYFYDNMQDIVRWTNIWSGVKGELYLGEIGWLSLHFKMDIFKIGRLQFNKAFGRSIPEINLKESDNFLGVHIPACGPLDFDECVKSVLDAQDFYAKYLPEFKYKCIICSSWLLYDGLKDMMKSDSNIIKFQSLFDIYGKGESDAIIRFIIGWGADREQVKEMEFTSRLKNEIKSRVLKGEKFYSAYGVIKDEYMKK